MKSRTERTPGRTTTARETRMAKNRTTLSVYFVLLGRAAVDAGPLPLRLRMKSGFLETDGFPPGPSVVSTNPVFTPVSEVITALNNLALLFVCEMWTNC